MVNVEVFSQTKEWETKHLMPPRAGHSMSAADLITQATRAGLLKNAGVNPRLDARLKNSPLENNNWSPVQYTPGALVLLDVVNHIYRLVETGTIAVHVLDRGGKKLTEKGVEVDIGVDTPLTLAQKAGAKVESRIEKRLHASHGENGNAWTSVANKEEPIADSTDEFRFVEMGTVTVRVSVALWRDYGDYDDWMEYPTDIRNGVTTTGELQVIVERDRSIHKDAKCEKQSSRGGPWKCVENRDELIDYRGFTYRFVEPGKVTVQVWQWESLDDESQHQEPPAHGQGPLDGRWQELQFPIQLGVSTAGKLLDVAKNYSWGKNEILAEWDKAQKDYKFVGSLGEFVKESVTYRLYNPFEVQVPGSEENEWVSKVVDLTGLYLVDGLKTAVEAAMSANNIHLPRRFTGADWHLEQRTLLPHHTDEHSEVHHHQQQQEKEEEWTRVAMFAEVDTHLYQYRIVADPHNGHITVDVCISESPPRKWEKRRLPVIFGEATAGDLIRVGRLAELQLGTYTGFGSGTDRRSAYDYTNVLKDTKIGRNDIYRGYLKGHCAHSPAVDG